MTEQFVSHLDSELSPGKKCPILVTAQGTLKLNYNPVLSIWESACLSASARNDKSRQTVGLLTVHCSGGKLGMSRRGHAGL